MKMMRDYLLTNTTLESKEIDRMAFEDVIKLTDILKRNKEIQEGLEDNNIKVEFLSCQGYKRNEIIYHHSHGYIETLDNGTPHYYTDPRYIKISSLDEVVVIGFFDNAYEASNVKIDCDKNTLNDPRFINDIYEIDSELKKKNLNL